MTVQGPVRKNRLQCSSKIIAMVLKWTVCAGAGPAFLTAQTISFAPARSFGLETPALAGPNCLAVGDFNGDGKLDLIASNTSSDNLSFLAGNGDGTFQAPAAIMIPPPGAGANGPPPVRPDRCLVAADLNHDGRLDVAIVDGSSDRILVLFGKGDGTFGLPLVLSAGVRCYFVAAADFNGDGIPDLIAAATVRLGTPFLRATDPSGIAVLLSHGDGTFEPPKILKVGPLAETLAIGDVNRDGRLDLVGTVGGGYTSVFSLWRGNGDGTFQPPINHGFDAPGFASALGDVNGDGNLDVLATAPGAVLVFLGNDDGTFRPFVKTSSNLFLPAIQLADLNGDGRLDIVVSYSSNRPAVQLGNGDGSFGAPMSLEGPGGGTAPRLGDFNGDGVLDLALADGDSIGVYAGKGDGGFIQLARFVTTNRILGFWPGEWNGDGNIDLLAYGSGNGWIFEGDGRGNFSLGDTVDVDTSAVLAFADLNSDGRTDLIIGLGPNQLGVSLNQGGGHFAQPRRVFRLDWAGPQGTEPHIYQVFVCDLNRDRKSDLVISYGTQQPLTTVLLGNGDGTFTELAGSPAKFGTLAVADFNRDGIPDLLTPQLQILFGRSNGTLGDPVTAGGFPLGCEGVGVADVDGDRVPDLLCYASTYDGGWAWADVYRGDSSGGFSPLPTENLAWLGIGPQFADFSGDGVPDLILSPNRDHIPTLFLGNGNGGFTQAATLPTSGSNTLLPPLVVDLNRDGKPDIVVADGTYRFSVFLNDSGRTTNPDRMPPGGQRRRHR